MSYPRSTDQLVCIWSQYYLQIFYVFLILYVPLSCHQLGDNKDLKHVVNYVTEQAIATSPVLVVGVDKTLQMVLISWYG